uniref:Uncharacterized protein n=1 Tax=Ignisphaera aggregans TaxID=334771 RepID=A0A7C4FE87_9CREN
MRLWLTPVLVLCILLLAPMLTARTEDLDLEVAILVDRASKLHSMGVNTTNVVEKLSSAVEAYEHGDFEKAWAHLNEARKIVEELEKGAGEAYSRLLLLKVATVALLASIPIAVYLLLPRAYLYLWFRVRRKWVVRWPPVGTR